MTCLRKGTGKGPAAATNAGAEKAVISIIASSITPCRFLWLFIKLYFLKIVFLVFFTAILSSFTKKTGSSTPNNLVNHPHQVLDINAIVPVSIGVGKRVGLGSGDNIVNDGHQVHHIDEAIKVGITGFHSGQ